MVHDDKGDADNRPQGGCSPPAGDAGRDGKDRQQQKRQCVNDAEVESRSILIPQRIGLRRLRAQEMPKLRHRRFRLLAAARAERGDRRQIDFDVEGFETQRIGALARWVDEHLPAVAHFQ